VAGAHLVPSKNEQSTHQVHCRSGWNTHLRHSRAATTPINILLHGINARFCVSRVAAIEAVDVGRRVRGGALAVHLCAGHDQRWIAEQKNLFSCLFVLLAMLAG